MDNSAPQYPTDLTTFIGLKTFYHQTSYPIPRRAIMSLKDLILALEPIASTLFLVHLFLAGALLEQVLKFNSQHFLLVKITQIPF